MGLSLHIPSIYWKICYISQRKYIDHQCQSVGHLPNINGLLFIDFWFDAAFNTLKRSSDEGSLGMEECTVH